MARFGILSAGALMAVVFNVRAATEEGLLEHIDEMMAEVDKNEDGLVSLEEVFQMGRGEEMGESFEKEFMPQVQEFFPKADANGDHNLNKEEFIVFIQHLEHADQAGHEGGEL